MLEKSLLATQLLGALACMVVSLISFLRAAGAVEEVVRQKRGVASGIIVLAGASFLGWVFMWSSCVLFQLQG